MALTAPFTGAARAADSDTHVAVISIDGLGAGELLGKPSCLGENSTIRALAKRGAYSRGVTGVLPTITYPSHATLVTGTLPARHGVIDNGLRGVWFKDRADIKVETLWDAARKAGRSVAIVTWPSTYGAAADWLVPEDLSNHAVATGEIRKGSSPGLFDALSASGGAPALMPFAHREAGLPLDAMTARFGAEVVRRHKPRLLLTHFLDYDHRMHAAPYSAEACKALERTDAHVTQLVEAYRTAGILERTTIFIVSDHGFIAVKKMVSVFALLKDAGWDSAFPGLDVDKAFDLKVAGGSVAFYPQSPAAGNAAAIARLKPRIDSQHGRVVRWISQERARELGGFPGAAFTLCARPGYSFAVRPPSSPELLVDPGDIGGMHGFCPDEREMDALFIASGHGVRAAGAIAKMPMVDVGPTIAAYLSVALPQASGRDRSDRFRSSARPATGR